MNFIETIEIKNFKSIRHQKIEGCKRINVFVGPPNVGKSNILEALGLYSVTQQVNSERFPLNSICRYNHYSDLYFDKNLQNRIEIILNEEHTLSFSKKNNSTSEFEIFIQTKGILEHSVFNTIVGEYNNFKINSVPAEDDLRNSEIYKVKYYHFEKANFINKIKSLSLSIPNGDNLLDILHGNSDLRKAYSELLNIYGLKLNISDSEIAIAK